MRLDNKPKGVIKQAQRRFVAKELQQLFRTKDYRRVCRFFSAFNRTAILIKKKFKLKSIKDAEYVFMHVDLIKSILGDHYKTTLSVLIKYGFLEYNRDVKLTNVRCKYIFRPLSFGMTADMRTAEVKKEVEKKVLQHYDNKIANDAAAMYVRECMESVTVRGKEISPATSTDMFSGRIYHHVTTMASIRRLRDIEMDNQKVVEIDIKQSQIKLFAEVLRQDGRAPRFVKLIDNGNDLYDLIQDYLFLPDRSAAKEMVYKMIFGKADSFLSEKFYELFPELRPILHEIKTIRNDRNPSRKVHSNLAWELQNMETRILKRAVLTLQDFGIKTATIHDSFIVKMSDCVQAKQIIQQVLDQYMNNAELVTNVYSGYSNEFETLHPGEPYRGKCEERKLIFDKKLVA